MEDTEEHDAFHDKFVSSSQQDASTTDRPHIWLATPVYEKVNNSSPIVAAITSLIPLDVFLSGILREGDVGMHAVLTNHCGSAVTYELRGSELMYRGPGDYHNPKYNDDVLTTTFSGSKWAPGATTRADGHCVYALSLYPSGEGLGESNVPVSAIFVSVVAIAFFLMVCYLPFLAIAPSNTNSHVSQKILVFLVYDRFVDHRNKKVLNLAAKSNVIVSSLFPGTVRDRMLAEAAADAATAHHHHGKHSKADSMKKSLRSMLMDGEDDDDYSHDGIGAYGSRPIAELFPETTIMFADIAGFTAWSSSREPTQVFTLLETM